MEALDTRAEETTALDAEKARRLAEIDERRSELKDELSRLDKERGPIEAELLEQMAETGISKIRIDGRTIYLYSQTWASVERGEEEPNEEAYARACKALAEAGLADMVETRFNTHRLSAFVRELAKNGESIPAQFEGAIKVTDRYSVRSRKAS